MWLKTHESINYQCLLSCFFFHYQPHISPRCFFFAFQINFSNSWLIFFLLKGKDGSKVTTVVATPGQGPDRPQEVSYSDTKVIGNGSFGVVFQAKLCDTGELVAIKKVLQDKRFKVIFHKIPVNLSINEISFSAESRITNYETLGAL